MAEREMVKKFLQEYEDIFTHEGRPLKATGRVKHRIDTGDHGPIRRAPYRIPYALQGEMKKQINSMLEEDIIRPSKSPWSAPVVLVEKQNPGGEKKYRFCVDFRELNKITKRDYFPIPHIQDTIDALGGAQLFTTLDLTKGYWQIEVDPKDREKTAFSVPWGHYECNRMPFGLVNSPSTWQRLMMCELAEVIGTHCYVYLDDIIIFSSRNVQEHLKKLRTVFDKIREANLTLNPEKCNFLKTETPYLGFIISNKGIRPCPRKTQVIKNFPRPQTVTEIKSFLGLVGYYRRFILQFAHYSSALTRLTKKNAKFIWDNDCQEAFDYLRESLTKAPVLQYPDPDRKFYLSTDASGFAIGAILHQVYDGQELPVAYASRQMVKAELNYSTTEKECLALIWGIKQFRNYLWGQEFTVYTDHQPLKWLMGIKDPSTRLMRWSLALSEYTFNIEYKPGKKHTNVDALSRIRTVRFIDTECEPLWDRQKIRQLQREDTKLKKLYQDTVNGKRNNYFIDVDGLLYKIKENYESEDVLTLPTCLIPKVIKVYHDLPFAGHMGFEKTYNRIKKRFYWPNMNKDIQDYINACEPCARRKTPNHLKPAPLQKFSIPREPFYRIAMDIVGPLPVTYKGNKYILTVQDALTKYVEAFPLPDQTAPTVAKAFVKGIILRHGTPKQLLTDLGKNFVSNLMENICNVLQIQHLKTTAYRPQTNGALERFHRTLKDLLSHDIEDNQRDWDEWLPYALAAYSSATHSTTEESPFYLLFGRDMDYPFEEIFRPLRIKYDADTNYVSEFLQRMKIAHHNAIKNIEKNVDRCHTNFNKKAEPHKFKEGDRVYVYQPATKIGISSKLDKKWEGPYRIIKIRGVNAEIREIHGRKQLKTHVNRLKFCNTCPKMEDKLANVPTNRRPQNKPPLDFDSDESDENSEVSFKFQRYDMPPKEVQHISEMENISQENKITQNKNFGGKDSPAYRTRSRYQLP